MSSLVSEFILIPVLRQARRFSSGPPAPESSIATSESSQPSSSSVRGSWTIVDDAAVCEGHEDGSYESTVERRGVGSDSVPRQPVPEVPVSLDGSGRAPEIVEEEHMTRNTNQQNTAAVADMATETLVRPDVEVGPPTPAAVDGRTVLPENDGMGLLRQRILAIQAREDIQQDDKARLMHSILMEGYNRSRVMAPVYHRPVSPSSPVMSEQSRTKGPLESALNFLNNRGDNLGVVKIKVTEEDLRPTFVPRKPADDDAVVYHTSNGDVVDLDTDDKLGCEHYRRNIKKQCATCERWYTCRLCHDKVEDHILPRRETKNMLCMLCGCAQRVSSACAKCGVMAARYYCDVCKLWNDDPSKPIYHCDRCGICRVGHGLERDFFHCDKCTACINISIRETHKCIERSLDCDCPICGDYMFSSRNPVVFMRCGHSIHKGCYGKHITSSYKCPICNKSVVNMDIQFRQYDAAILNQPMPAEYRDTRAIVTCNDCSAKSQTAYHWLGLKCSICLSYNTVPVQILNLPTNAALSDPPVNVPGLDAVLLSSGGVGAVLASLPSHDAVLDAEGTTTEPSEQLSRSTLLPPPLPAMDIPRGSVATRPGTSTGQETDTPAFSSYRIPDRIARSVSPIPVIGGPEEDEEREARDFWGGVANGNILTSGGESCESEEDDEDSCSEDEEDLDGDEDEDEEDDDDILLFGHR